MEIGWIAMDGGWGWLHVQNGDFINLQILVTYLSGLRFSLANAFPCTFRYACCSRDGSRRRLGRKIVQDGGWLFANGRCYSLTSSSASNAQAVQNGAQRQQANP